MTVASDLGIESDTRYRAILECKARQFLGQIIADQERDTPFFEQCPRCGGPLAEPMVRNALSRREDIHICSGCGVDEAMMDMAGRAPLHITEWAFVGAVEDEAAYEFCDTFPEAV